MSGRGNEAAYGRRQRVLPHVRRAGYFALSRRSVAGGLLGGGPPGEQAPAPHADYINLEPAVESASRLSDLAARVNWYLPDVRLPLVVSKRPGDEVAPSLAPWMDPALVHDPGWLEQPPEGRPHHVIHRLGVAEALTVARSGRASVLADPAFYHVADLGWMWLRWQFARMPTASSPAAMERLAQLGGKGTSAFVLATGPSAQLVDPTTVDAEVRIACNSAVRDAELLRTFKPNLICFIDPVFHYGPSRYAAAFRADLVKAAAESDALLVTYELFAGLLLAHHPELEDRLIIVRANKAPAWNWPSPGQMAVRMTGNVLTAAMLPMAFALSDTVQIAGCDGRNPDENYFWRHNARTQYSDELMQSAFETHPGFFRDRDYSDYYDTHCALVEDILATAEREGKRAVGVTPSHIPALKSRGAPAFPA